MTERYRIVTRWNVVVALIEIALALVLFGFAISPPSNAGWLVLVPLGYLIIPALVLFASRTSFKDSRWIDAGCLPWLVLGLNFAAMAIPIFYLGGGV